MVKAISVDNYSKSSSKILTRNEISSLLLSVRGEEYIVHFYYSYFSFIYFHIYILIYFFLLFDHLSLRFSINCTHTQNVFLFRGWWGIFSGFFLYYLHFFYSRFLFTWFSVHITNHIELRRDSNDFFCFIKRAFGQESIKKTKQEQKINSCFSF